MKHLDNIFHRLRRTGLTAKPGKCQFGMKWCSYFGHVVGGGEFRVETSKVEAFQRIKLPDTKNNVRAFLSLTGYYRRFVPNYATMAGYHTELIRKTAESSILDSRWDRGLHKTENVTMHGFSTADAKLYKNVCTTNRCVGSGSGSSVKPAD